MIYILSLLEEVRRIADPAADELADFIDHVLEHPGGTVADAFNLSGIVSEAPALECERP